MPLEPRIPKPKILTKQCAKCHCISTTEDYTKTHSIFYTDGFLPICNGCVQNYLRENEWSWDSIDRICRWADIPFIVKEWVRLEELNGKESTWPVYATVFAADCYESLGWADYNNQYKKLREAGQIEEEIPLLNEKKLLDMRRQWGGNYSDEELYYLDELYKGLLLTQNVNGDLQADQARKICKLSLEIDSRIRAGDKDVDKFLSSYDKLVKIAEFTPKNTKNAVDFDSFAEVAHWLEKRGRQNKFYDDVTRDIVDETLKNIENFNQRLYINEGGIGDEITQRLASLKNANKVEENIYGVNDKFDLDEYDNAGFIMEDTEEFIIGDGEGDE